MEDATSGEEINIILKDMTKPQNPYKRNSKKTEVMANENY